ncbi:MAG: PqqD family protein [Balneolaceae bacterium]|nr:PqqD family protein [Balneolaceae bacterium]
MNLKSKIKRTRDVVASPIDDEMVMFDADAGKYYGLNRVAASAWNLLEESKTVEELCKELLEIYDISEEQCQQEVLNFLPDLEDKGLIKVIG